MTAFSLFRPSSGQSTFSGLGRVTGVDYEAQILTATPWVIGLPDWTHHLISERDKSDDRTTIDPVQFLDGFVDNERAKREEVYFQPPPDVCDLCRKILERDKYMIDSGGKDFRGWACMCAACFVQHGNGIGWGYGQLYKRGEVGWRLVGGFAPKDAFME